MNKTITSILSGVVVGVLCSVNVAAASAVTNNEIFAAADNGIRYLQNQQQPNGSVAGYGGETDWAVIAAAASGQDPDALTAPGGASLLEGIKADALATASPATSIERRILAIEAADADSSNFGGVNYQNLLLAAHNNQQIGDPTLLNDDIFGILAALVTGNNDLVPVAQDALSYLLAHQSPDGGFSYTTNVCAFCGPDSNDTAAAIIALHVAQLVQLEDPKLITGEQAAISFLLPLQRDDGGFGYDSFSESDGSSTAWALMALNILGDAVKPQADAARAWLMNNQNSDGGFSYGAFGITDSDTFTSGHALIALLGTTWVGYPAPLDRPIEATPTVAEPTLPADDQSPQVESTDGLTAEGEGASVVAEGAQVSTVMLASSARPTSTETTSSSEASASAPESSASQEVKADQVVASSSSTLQPDPTMTSNRFIGYVLVGLALCGVVGYGVYAVRRRSLRA